VRQPDSRATQPPAPSPLRNPAFRKLLAISVTVAIGYGLVVPVLPNFARSFDVSLAAVGLVFFVFGLTRFLFGLVGGLVVDRFGDRFSVMAGLLIVSLSSYASGFATSFPQLVAARGFGGAGSALFIAGLMNRIIRTIEPEAMGRATGQFRSSFLVGISVGPLLGGVVAKYFGASATFHVYGTGLLIAAVIAYVVMAGQAVDRTAPRTSPLESLRAAAPLLRDRRYVLALAATFVGWWVLAGPAQTIGPVFAAEELDFSQFAIGAAVTLLSIGEVLILFAAGSAADRLGRKAVLVPSLVVTAVAIALVGQIEQAPWAYFPLMVAAGAGVAAGSTAAGGLLADSIRAQGAQQRGGSGAAVGVNQMAGDLGYLLAPTTVGFLAEMGGFGVAFIAAALPAALLLAWAVTLPNYRAERSGDDDQPAEAVTEPGSVAP
jgi:DHA1 family multidrug resistance protein-like MFS transporter